MSKIIDAINAENVKQSIPEFAVGDTVKVNVRIVEGNKERLQAFEGVVLKKTGEGARKMITVRKVFQGIGVERVFPIHSPRVESIKVLRKGDVKRAKLYYLRERTGKATRIKEKITSK